MLRKNRDNLQGMCTDLHVWELVLWIPQGGIVMMNRPDPSLVPEVKGEKDPYPILLEIQNELNLRQREWLKLLKVYDMSFLYHPGKANVVVDSLSRFSMGSTAHVKEEHREFARDVHRFARLGISLMDSTRRNSDDE
ncbi:hypothetical protein MTR67_051699 [Solanum verrucosum]|uniref:Uncharacterized protein n=1 Tax=Solanum verrucosum TaxID=315347 RepID=A0AAF0V6P6_SOLVR|nr:hypothetical protein MTR67_051699 [Solanum verrucosum]